MSGAYRFNYTNQAARQGRHEAHFAGYRHPRPGEHFLDPTVSTGSAFHYSGHHQPQPHLAFGARSSASPPPPPPPRRSSSSSSLSAWTALAVFVVSLLLSAAAFDPCIVHPFVERTPGATLADYGLRDNCETHLRIDRYRRKTLVKLARAYVDAPRGWSEQQALAEGMRRSELFDALYTEMEEPHASVREAGDVFHLALEQGRRRGELVLESPAYIPIARLSHRPKFVSTSALFAYDSETRSKLLQRAAVWSLLFLFFPLLALGICIYCCYRWWILRREKDALLEEVLDILRSQSGEALSFDELHATLLRRLGGCDNKKALHAACRRLWPSPHVGSFALYMREHAALHFTRDSHISHREK